MNPRLFLVLCAAVVAGGAFVPSTVSTPGTISGAARPVLHLAAARPATAAFVASATVHGKTRPLLPPRAPVNFGTAGPVKLPVGRAPKRPAISLVGSLNQPGLGDNPSDNPNGPSTPPDTTGSIGPSHYVEIVNSEIGVYSRADLGLVAKSDLNTWLGQPAPSNFANNLCDPQMQWDQSSTRWLFVVLACDLGDVHFLYGWSKTSDPSTLSPAGWCVFTQVTAGALADYPKLGHSRDYMIVGANAYGNTGNTPFLDSRLFWTATPAAGVSTCPATAPMTIKANLKNQDLSQAFTPVPVNTTSNATDGYVISAHDPSGPPAVPQSQLDVFHIDSAGAFHADGKLDVTTYAIPQPAPDLGGSSFNIDTLDGRLTQAVGDPVTGMYTQHTVDGGFGGPSKVTWYEIKIVASTPSLTQQGDLASATDWIFNAAISPPADGNGAAIFYSRSNASIDPYIGGQIRLNSTPAGAMEPGELVLGTSTAGANDFSCNNTGHSEPCRWGDYSGASPDFINANQVWGSNQALGPPPGVGLPAWTTRNFAVYVAIPPHAPTSVTVIGCSMLTAVNWTASTFDSGASDASYTIREYQGATVVAMQKKAAPASSALLNLSTSGSYTFTVTSTQAVGTSPESAHSNTVTPRCASAGPLAAPAPKRSGVNQAPAVSPPPTRP